MGNAEDLVERYRWAQRSRANEWGDPTYDLLLPLTAAVNDPVMPCPRCGAPTAFGPAASTTDELARTVAVGSPVQAHETVCTRDR